MNNKGFTLIELLVVIGIISVLSAIVVPNFMGARERARDAQRKSDIKQLQKALEMYKDDQTILAYPADFSAMTCDALWSNGVTNAVYMSKFPCDPLSTSGSVVKYTYTRNAGDSLKYTLYACLENKSDQQGVTGSTCNWGGSATGIQYQISEP